MSDRTYFRKWLRFTRATFEILLIVFFVAYAFHHRGRVVDIVSNLSLTSLVGCMVIYSLSHLWASASTARLLYLVRQRRPFLEILGIHINRLPAKYLPGGIWHTLGRGADLVGRGVDKRCVTQVLLLEQLLAIWWSGLLGLTLGVAAFPEARFTAVLLAAVWVAVGAGLFFLLRWRFPLLAAAAARLDVSLIYAAGWACLAAAFTVFLYSGNAVNETIIRTVASYLVSWMIGAVALFSPQGLGVFEFSMVKLLPSPRFHNADFLWYIGSYRIVVLLADLAAWGIGRALATVWNAKRMTRL